MRAARGRAELGPHSAKLYQGSIAGALMLDGNTNGVSLKDKLTDISIGPLIKDVAQRDVIEGRGNVALDVRAAGASVNAMKKSLAGNARIALHDGAIKGFNLGEALRKAESLTGSKTAQSQATDESQKTDFSEMTASFVIRNGVAHNDDLSAKAPLFRVSGAGLASSESDSSERSGSVSASPSTMTASSAGCSSTCFFNWIWSAIFSSRIVEAGA